MLRLAQAAHPDGTPVAITFSLNQGQIQSAKTAHLEFFLLNNHHSNVIVNGREWSLPYTGDTNGSFGDITGKTLFSIPSSLLGAGLNWLAFESTQHGTNFDDLEIGEIVLVLNK